MAGKKADRQESLNNVLFFGSKRCPTVNEIGADMMKFFLNHKGLRSGETVARKVIHSNENPLLK